ncbi:M3 family oligoendopeptidase [Candidatus Margulisiibacteriota bacterium]
MTVKAKNVRWDLSEFASGINDPHITRIIDETKKQAREFSSKYKGSLASLSPAGLKEAHVLLEQLLSPLYKISQYIHLEYSIKTNDDQIKALVAKIDEVESEIQNLLVFFDLELAKMPADSFQKFESPLLGEYGYHLSMVRKTAEYKLSEEVEKVINLKDLVGTNAHTKLYSELTSGFEFEFEVDGKKKKLNGSELRAQRYNPDPDVRQKAMKLFFQRYEDNKLVISHLYNNILKDYAIEKNLRGYKSAISIRNVSQDLDDKAVQVLHEVTTESSSLVHRYYKLKAKILGLPKMTLADIYAPLPEVKREFAWDESKEIVLNCFKSFDKDFYSMADLMFKEKRIDAPVCQGKRGGAFCYSSIPEMKPFVMLNFLGKPRDVTIMAHELGHAIHSMLCSGQTLSNFHPILPFAETASIFSEMVVTERLLAQENDKQLKISLLCEKLEDVFASSHRQNMFSRFEMATHKQIAKQIMSPQELCGLYNEELKIMFGNAVECPKEYQWEWSAIPHIFEWPFYVYSYNFANLLVIALYQKYLEEGQSFMPQLHEFLQAGSSASPDDLAKIVNVDIRDPNFWQKSLKYIDSLITNLEQLVIN